MKQTYTKLPLILLTLLNYAPYARPIENNPKCGCTETNQATIENEASDNTVNVESVANEFIQAQIPENFDTFFNAHFSENVNEFHAYLLLSQIPVNLPIEQSTVSYTAQDFQNQLQALLNLKENNIVEITYADSDYKANIPLGSLNAFGCNTLLKATINPEQNILFVHMENDQMPNVSYVGLINTQTLVSMVIPCAAKSEIKEIGLVANASELAIIRQDDTIVAYALPTEFTNFAPTLKQRAFVSYAEIQINKLGQKITESSIANNTNNALRIYAKLPIEEIYKLGTFIFDNQKLLPESLYNRLYNEKMNWLQQIITIASNTKLVAESLDIDIDTLIDKIESNEITQEQILAILSPETASTEIQV